AVCCVEARVTGGAEAQKSSLQVRTAPGLAGQPMYTPGRALSDAPHRLTVVVPVHEAIHLYQTSLSICVKPLALHAVVSFGPSVVALAVVIAVVPAETSVALAQLSLPGGGGARPESVSSV